MDNIESSLDFDEKSVEQCKACLSTLTEYAQKTRQILTTWLQNYYKQSIQPKSRSIIPSLLLDAKYILTEDEYRAWELGDSFVSRFSNHFNRLLKPFQNNMTDQNLNVIIGYVVQGLLKDWEARITFRVNVFGALKFEKEIRGVIAFLSGVWVGTRDAFQRLSQISLVLGLESIDDLSEYWGVTVGGIRWKLSKADVKRILGLR